MKRAIWLVGLLAMGILGEALAETDPGKLSRIEELIHHYGKPRIIEVIMQERAAAITLEVDGHLRTFYGRPDPVYVTPRTILIDLGKMGWTVADLGRALAQEPAQKETKRSPQGRLLTVKEFAELQKKRERERQEEERRRRRLAALERQRQAASAEEEEKAAPPAPPPKGYLLEVRSWSWGVMRGGRYVEVKGEVKNISGKPLRRVQALVSFYDANKQFITSKSAFIEFNPILPDQVSPFRLMETYNPAMQTAKLQFKFFAGEQIPTYFRK